MFLTPSHIHLVLRLAIDCVSLISFYTYIEYTLHFPPSLSLASTSFLPPHLWVVSPALPCPQSLIPTLSQVLLNSKIQRSAIQVFVFFPPFPHNQPHTQHLATLSECDWFLVCASYVMMALAAVIFISSCRQSRVETRSGQACQERPLAPHLPSTDPQCMLQSGLWSCHKCAVCFLACAKYLRSHIFSFLVIITQDYLMCSLHLKHSIEYYYS